MKDEEIINIAKFCFENITSCSGCPVETEDCEFKPLDKLIEITMRQKAEINKLKAELSVMKEVANSLKMYMENEKKDAIREFARELKCGVPQETGVIRCKDVDTLVKEMTEGNNDRQS